MSFPFLLSRRRRSAGRRLSLTYVKKDAMQRDLHEVTQKGQQEPDMS